MASTLFPLTLPPGVVRRGTAYASKGRWYNSSLVRFEGNVVRPIGGWSLARTAAGGDIQATGVPRASHTWRKNDSTTWVAVGTTGTPSKLYAYTSSTAAITDITPAGLTNGAADGSLVTGTGRWDLDPWDVSPWGGSVAAGTITDAATWSLDSFGEVLVACLTADGKLYSSTPTTQAAVISGAPTGCRAVCVTPERFLLALGAGSDPRLVQWPSRETLTTWTPAAGNTAGSLSIASGGRLMVGHAGTRETLLWTDMDLWALRFVGGNLVYGLVQVGDHCGLIGPNAAVVIGGTAYWMGNGQFFFYDGGTVRQLPCDVREYVFGDLARPQKAKICAVTNAAFGEVTWYYPSAGQGGTENDRYVTFNFREGWWLVGQLARAAGNDADVFNSPLLWSTDGHLFSHETGQDRGGASAFIESGPLEIGDGDRRVLVEVLIPDALDPSTPAGAFAGGDEDADGDVFGTAVVGGNLTATFYTAEYPDTTERASQGYTLTTRTDVRVSGRQVRVKIAQPAQSGALYDGTYTHTGTITYGGTGPGADFRIGTFRLGVIPQGRR